MKYTVFPIIIGSFLFWSVTVLITFFSRSNLNGLLVYSLSLIVLFICSMVTGYLSKHKGWLYGLFVGLQSIMFPFLVLLLFFTIWYFKGAEWTGGNSRNIFELFITIIIIMIINGAIGSVGGFAGMLLKKINSNNK